MLLSWSNIKINAMRKALLLPTLLYLASLPAHGVSPDETRFHNISADTTRINELLVDAKGIKNPEERVAHIARKFIGTPYVAKTLEGDREMLTINLDELDCTTFVETALALAFTAGEGRTSWRDYVFNLEKIRYRNGEMDGYPSRLHYVCNWIVDNCHRGNLTEATSHFTHHNYIERSITFMSENREKYAALSDSANYARIKNIELGYSRHRFPYIKTHDLSKKETKGGLREGDVVALVTSMKTLDVTHMGIIVKNGDEPYLLHASSSNGKVEITNVPLHEFMKRNRSLSGIRVVRLKQ